MRVKEGRLIKIDDTIAGDTATQTAVDTYVTGLDTALAPLSYKKVVGETTFDVTRASVAESALGDLVADAYLGAARALEPLRRPILPSRPTARSGPICSRARPASIWFSDLFQVTPLGHRAGPAARVRRSSPITSPEPRFFPAWR